MAVLRSLQFWAFVLLGLFHFSARCDARAVNVSNTWTMPQEGLNVFYRFFRDRISWFEADAVCQFHHANLVTVDNSFQFDATRDLLRELDVNDIVWIGLMRPQSSERFMWSNSRPLVTDTGYWAESLPLMDAPLCAVIDPIRDYRWHALRCGGPETASFLCEMPVPSWADACILKDMPNLTMQYMADTASIELIRNCEEEGLLRQTCKGKQDRERALRELICPRERLEAQRINDITNSHFKSLQIINSIRTDNNENNDIELLPLGQASDANSELVEALPTEKNTVQRLIEQFNVDELMQADEPVSNTGYSIPGQIPKPVKKAAKKVVLNGEYPKKEKAQKYLAAEQEQQQQKKKALPVALEDMMMGDQPMGEPELPEHAQDDDVSNEIIEPLPHKKKVLPQDLKTMATITEKLPEEYRATAKTSEAEPESLRGTSTTTPTSTSVAPSTTTTTTASTTTSTTTTTTTTVAGVPSTSEAAVVTTTSAAVATASEEFVTSSELPGTTNVATTSPEGQTSALPATATLPSATIGHPMHPQQPRSNIITEETQHPHIKESPDNSHFIPPMLLVKSHYVPPTRHEHGDAEHHPHHEGELGGHNTTATTTTITVTSAYTATTEAVKTEQHFASVPAQATETDSGSGKVVAATQEQDVTGSTEAVVSSATAATALSGTTTETHAKIIDDAAERSNLAGTPAAEQTTVLQPVMTEASSQSAREDSEHVETATTTTIATTTARVGQDNVGSVVPISAVKRAQVEDAAASTQAAEVTLPAVTAGATVAATQKPEVGAQADKPKLQTETEAIVVVTSDAPATAPTTAAATTTTAAAPTTRIIAFASRRPATTSATHAATTEAPTPTHNFLNEETEMPFKPNRKRVLTQPETVSYFKKILG